MAIIKVLFRHQEKEVEVPEGTNLLQVVALAGVPLEGDCGGKGTCGKCKVRVLSGNILETTMAERKFLFPDELAAGWVLACQHEVIGDTVVETRVHSDDYQSKNVMKWQGSKVKVEPCVEKFFLSMELPTLDDHTPDLERLIYCLPQRNDIKISRNILSTLPRLLREAGFQVTAVLVGDRIVAVERGNTSGRVYGIALDIGTTTLAGYLVDLARGEVLSVSVSSNPQSVYGADVITRIYHAAYNKDGLKQLQDIVLGAVNGIISSLLKEAGVKKEEIYEMVVVGNTAMSHLFLGIDPANLAFSPFIPAFKCAVELQSSELGLQLLPESRVLLLPNISGFVGSDTVGAMLAARIDQRKGTCLLVDIGTNAEVVLASQGRILICSSAAGPAFEGSHIRHGMRAVEGAIESVIIRDDVCLGVIGNLSPRGICGSGLIDAVAEMLKTGIIDETGRFVDTEKGRCKLNPQLQATLSALH
ncbi:MAG TPA: ASKHA domain-containing protein [Bacillota bacterium]|nr:ASKHA domain-containing protein [Bacillota bacterium]